ncbi:4-phosphoerythronate dehydrogenase [Candidatus Schneideria nysicola]|uniref:4-phosphoerythronate dehydrogenase n=1 Tax=Candidatus Schneideria nysicola TaxID=1081631 RepID=UPI001FEFD873|nr:4-phosphoerythronate dehydrogenase [Candidatus Schneideria nysicola]
MVNILVDENIPYAKTIFSGFGNIQYIPGRNISAKTLKGIDALIVRSVTRVNSTLLQDSQVKFVGTATSGTDHIDKEWLEKSGISFSVAQGCNAIAVVEYVLSVLLWLAKRDNFFLCEKTIGIIGVGNIGRVLYEKLKILGINTLLCDPPLEELGVSGNWSSLEKIISESDILTFHIPLTYTGKYATWHKIDEEFLSTLPEKRILINTCRGSIIDQRALLKVLEKGKLLNVILDVWENEPNISIPLLNKIDIGTPHVAGYTIESKIRSIIKIFNDYLSFINQPNPINKSILDYYSYLPEYQNKIYYLHNILEEKDLCKLAHILYNPEYDDIKLRQLASSGGFDDIRKSYYNRREWSSLCIKTDINLNKEKLASLGFCII